MSLIGDGMGASSIKVTVGENHKIIGIVRTPPGEVTKDVVSATWR